MKSLESIVESTDGTSVYIQASVPSDIDGVDRDYSVKLNSIFIFCTMFYDRFCSCVKK